MREIKAHTGLRGIAALAVFLGHAEFDHVWPGALWLSGIYSFFYWQNPAVDLFFMLSGFTFPIRNMPVLAQWITFLNPVRYLMEIVRGVFLQGAGVEALWPQMVALAVFGVIILGLSVLRFQKRLE